MSEFVLVEILHSDDEQIRVSIAKDGRSICRIQPERWDVVAFDRLGHVCWIQWGSGASFTDDIEIARAMARESLRIAPRREMGSGSN